MTRAHTRTVTDAAAMLRRRELSSVELVRELLDRADATQRLGAYIARFDEQALAAAARADADFSAGVDRGPLQGIPVGIKDNLFCSDGPTTGQSLVDDPAFRGSSDATAVRRLRAAGAVIMGKLTLSELAIGAPDLSSPYPRPRNPWDLGCWPGGSSSGTGVAVAAGLVLAGLGSDTAGSIRIPSAVCGITGLKPTFGRVPVAGCIPLAASLDHVGPMARSAQDCAALLAVLAGHDPADPSSLTASVPDYVARLAEPVRGLRLGVFEPADLRADSAADAAAAFADAVQALIALGLESVEVDLPDYDSTSIATKIILEAESFAQHERNLRSRWADHSRSTRLRVGAGLLTSSTELLLAQRRRANTRRLLRELFETVDVVVAPTLTMGAPRYGVDEAMDREAMRATAHTMYASGVGYPALAVPIGFTADGLPLSMQLVGRPLDEAVLLGVGAAYQRATDWHRLEPSLRPASSPLPDISSPPPAPTDDAERATVELLARRAGIDPGEDLAALVQASVVHRAEIETLRAAALA